ncbi:hypothetical protein NW759_005090 [Fusarium solani]|nr:hypothetical protein NW759_005090 [Fusarium solani]
MHKQAGPCRSWMEEDADDEMSQAQSRILGFKDGLHFEDIPEKRCQAKKQVRLVCGTFGEKVSLHIKSVTASRDVETRSRWVSFESRHCRPMLGVVQSWESVVLSQLNSLVVVSPEGMPYSNEFRS